ncbi:PEFG-CTERM sorting domain-containing protein [Candidatus Nitrosotalea bavarica]|jgi:predicted secreted protein with PEFG-CTERM motif|uniref:PEFG-CTERM sorting domain-containing protein n=1 Tax=Candidatus Nitrosotalea bavarica TaxID=1903277 RepID=UPI000C7102A5|nr:PEFG-CTERM sorting domain-containing protein [Candidatus Nitrosotalea bavarica]
MSTHKEYALIAILATAAIVGVVPAFAANNPYLACPDCNDTNNIQQIPQVAITVTTDKPGYDHNSQIMITGHVVNPYPGQDVALEITSPSDNVVTAAQVTLDSNGDFTKTVSTAGNLWLENGQYTIKAQQGDEQARVNSAIFQIAGEVTPSPPAIPEFGPIAALVFAIAIISIIAVSAKTGLRFMPKY